MLTPQRESKEPLKVNGVKPTLKQVVEAWAEVCLNTDECPSLDKMHPITWAKSRLPALVEGLEKAGFEN